MINCVKTQKGNRFDILDNRKKSLMQITGLNYAELEKLYWEIGIELQSEHDAKELKIKCREAVDMLGKKFMVKK